MSAIVTTGTFDGLHRGHIRLLEFLKAEGERKGLSPTVVTFDCHPLSVIAPDREPGLLMSPDDRDRILNDLGIKVETVRFDRILMATKSADWMKFLKERFDAAAIVMGYDNTVGSDGLSLSTSDYRAIGDSLGLSVLWAPVEEGVSSSAIRKALAAGDLDEANSMLGRRFEIEGVVIGGKALGRTIGHPTANLQGSVRYQLPANGVYLCEAVTENGDKFPSAVNIGVRPSVDGEGAPVSIEAHLIGFDGNLYGDRLRLRFMERLREERRFDNLDSLRDAIAADVNRAKHLYLLRNPATPTPSA